MRINKKIVFAFAFIFTGIQGCSSKGPVRQNSATVEASQIIEDMKAGKNLLIENKTVNGDIDFTALGGSTKESPGLNRVYVSSAVSFVNCIFNGRISSYSSSNDLATLCDFSKSLSFLECQFKEDVLFRESIFHSNVIFNKSFFVKKATFEGSRFMGEAQFNGVSFGEEARFQNIFFYNKTNFMDAAFGKTAYFQSSNFYADAQLSTTRWEGYADFSLCVYHGGCFFNYSVFNNKAIFNNSTFRGRAEFFQAKFTGNSEFKNCYYFGNVNMQAATVITGLDLSGSYYLGAIPDSTAFTRSENTRIVMDQIKK